MAMNFDFNKFSTIFLVFILSASFLTGLTNALPTSSNNARISYLNCVINYNEGLLNTLSKIDPSIASINSASLNQLSNDQNQLNTLLNSNDSQINSFVKGSLQSDLQNSRGNFKSSISQLRQLLISKSLNRSLMNMSVLKSDYATLIQSRNSCFAQSYSQAVSDRINYYLQVLVAYQLIISNHTSQTNNLTATTLDPTLMNQVISDANSSIVQPMQNALTALQSMNSTNESEYYSILNEYSLFDSASSSNEMNYHFHSRFILAYLQSRAIQLTSLANSDGVSMAQYQTDFDSANSTLNQIGNLQYSKGQEQQLYEQFRTIHSDLINVSTQIFLSRHLTTVLTQRYSDYSAILANYSALVAKWSNTTDSLTNSTLNVSALTEVLNNANQTILMPIENAIVSNNTQSMKLALQDYCLYDSCQANSSSVYNFHLAAQFALNTVNARYMQIQSLAQAKNVSVSNYQTDYQSTQSELSSILPNYDDAQTQAVLWSDIGKVSHDEFQIRLALNKAA